jgi:putative nucleotidyltransferase with HDIG domain
MDQDALQQFRAEVVSRRNLPTIPSVLTRILALVDSEGANARELVQVVEHDQALTARILRLANSAFFGQSRKVATIPRSILVLGFSTVRNLALGAKVWEALGPGVARRRLEELWAHAVVVALGTKALATRLCDGDPDEAFTAGLLHDVGRIVLASRFGESYWTAVGGVAESEPVEQMEQATFGVTHAEVGAWLLEAWNLPPAIVEALREHHAAEAKPGFSGLLSITDRLVAWTDLSTGVLRSEGGALLDVVAARGITPEAWQRLVGELQAASSNFGGP